MTQPTEHSYGVPELDAITAAGNLTGALEAVAKELKSLRKYGRTSRLFIVVQAAAIVLAVLAFAISIVVVSGQYQQQLRQARSSAAIAAATAQVAKRDNIRLCIAVGTIGVQQIGLWEYILRLSGPPKTAQERKIRDKFVHHLMVVFAPRNCSALGGGKK